MMRFYLHLAFALGLALILSSLSVNYWHKSDASLRPHSRDRAAATVEALKMLPLTAKNLVLFLGSSDIELGVNPILFDEISASLGQETQSYNLALRTLHASNFRTFLQILLGEFAERGGQARAVVVGIAPGRLTQESYTTLLGGGSGEAVVAEGLAAAQPFRLGDPAYWAQQVQARLNSLLFAGTNASMRRKHLARKARFRFLKQPAFIADPIGARVAQFANLWNDPIAQPPSTWNPEARGHSDFCEKSSPQCLERYFQLRGKDNAFRTRFMEKIESAYGPLSLNFHESLVLQLEKALLSLRKITPRLVVLVAPIHADGLWRAGSEERLANLLARIQKNTGAEIWNFYHEPFPENEYSDFFHLNSSGQKRLAARLARLFAGAAKNGGP